MSNKSSSIVRFRLDQIPNLPEKVWAAIGGSYNGQKWDVPEERELLEAIVGASVTDELYEIKDTVEQNIRLRSILSPCLKSNDPSVRLAAIEWVVYDWGHVRGKSEKHKNWPDKLGNFSLQVIDGFIAENYKNRIASWSKVLGFADSDTYAIYDARVAMALNAILDDIGYTNRFYMPPPSSDKLKESFSHQRKHIDNHYSGRRNTYLGYFDYMDLLKALVTKNLAADVLEAEMKLFAHGMTLGERYAAKHGLAYA